MNTDTDTQIANLLAQNAAIFSAYEQWSNGQVMLLGGTANDPNSFDSNGSKSGALGYYPVVNASQQTIYVPCIARLKEIALGGANAETLAEVLANAQSKLGQVDDALNGYPAFKDATNTALGSRVRTDTAGQNLSDQQKANARTNIDALSRTAGQIVWGDVWPGIDPTGATDCSNALSQVIYAANGKVIDFNGATIKAKGLYIGDIPVWIRNANFIHQQANRIFLVRKSVTQTQAVSALSTFFFGAQNGPGQTLTKIVCPNAYLYGRGDVARLSSSDTYSWCTQYAAEQGNTAMFIYMGDLVKLTGVGQDYTGKSNGGFYQGDVVTNAAGSSAIVHSVSAMGTATETIILRKMTGNFASGDALYVNGTVRGIASGAPYLVTPEILTYQSRYTSNVTVSKYGDTPFVMENCSVTADGDVDSIVGAANRTAPFTFEGGVAPVIRNLTCYSAWTRCIRYSSVWAPRVDGLHIVKLPNNANPSESAYGYGIDCSNATAYGSFSRLTGGNCRHAFTTNSDADINTSNYGARAPWYYDGAPKYNTVFDSHISGNVAEPFDTHPGDIFTTFNNCIAEWGDGSGMAISGSGGFKTRGFATRYYNCVSVGGQLGFNDYSGMYDAGFQYEQHYSHCEARSYASRGFVVSNSAVVGKQRNTVYDGCWVRDRMNSASVPFYPTGFGAFYANTSVTLINCGAANWNGTPFTVGSAQTLDVINFTLDYRQGGSSAPRIESAGFALMIDGLRVLRDVTNPSTPNTYLRNMSNAGGYVSLKNFSVTEGAVVAYPELTLISEEGGGSLKPYCREMGKYLLRTSSVPSGNNPTGGNWSVGDRAINTNPTAGGYEGWVYTSAGWKGYGAIAA